MDRRNDRALRARAEAVIPGGMFGHQSTALLPDDYPQYSVKAKGAHLWDADGGRVLDLMCAYGPNLFGYGATGWDIGAGLTAPLFNGGALKARRQQAREAAGAASARYQQTVLTAFAQVADALTALSADEDSRAAHQRSLDQADENLRLTKVAYERGGGAFLDVLDAQRRVNENRASLARAEGQRLADAVRLFAATGADWRAAGG